MKTTNKQNVSPVRQVYKLAQELGIDDWRELWSSLDSLDDDFEIEDYRFVSDERIDEIQRDELSGDEYTLGCFNSWFIADILDIDVDVIEAMQKAEAFDAIGKLIISMGKVDELQKEYSGMDGYGHHFACYDGNDNEVWIGEIMYHYFKVN